MNTFKFILVDDDQLVITFSKMLIKKTFGGADIKTFVFPEAGLEHLQSEPPDFEDEAPTVLFLDINMPGMSGWEFLEQFESLDEGVKNKLSVFILSSSVDDRDKERARMNHHVVDYLVKPLTKDAIMACAHAVLAESQAAW